jgi:hypothetical protein
MSIRDVEQFDGEELAEWNAHVNQFPFTVDLFDFLCQKICRAIRSVWGGSQVSPRADSIVQRDAVIDRAKINEINLRAGFGG